MASRKKIFFFALTTALAIVAASGIAHAAPTAAERETARRLMDEGKARMKANEPARAIEAFQKANDIMHVPTTGLALAKAHLAAGHLIEAREAALEVGRSAREAGEPAILESARRHAREMASDLKTKIPTVKLKVKNGPAAKVLVDDVEIPALLVNEPIAVNPGKRVFAVRNAEGAEAKGEIELVEKDVKEIELTVPAAGEAPAISSSSSSAAPTTSTPPPAPRPKVHGFGNDDVDFRPSQRTALAEGLIYGGFGVGVIGLGIGGVTGAMTLSKASAVEPQCENNICAPAARSDLDSAHTLATVSTISVIVGLVGAGVGVVGLALPKRSTTSTRKAEADTDRSAARSGLRSMKIVLSGNGVGGTF